MNKLSFFFLLLTSLSIGIADYITTTYGLSIGLIEGDGMYMPFLSSIVLIVMGLFADSVMQRTTFNTAKDKKVFGYVIFGTVSFLSMTMIFPIINNVSLII